jgi:hypothetical protein
MYLIFSGFALIFMNLGTREEGSLSAYSIFNKGYYSLLGTFKPEDVDGMFGKNVRKTDRENDKEEKKRDKSEPSPFDGLNDE